MAAKHTLHVALTEPLVKYVAGQVAAGRYATANEVVRAGLRLLIERDEIGGPRAGASERGSEARHG